ncbi:hypothetical protein [Tenacibaculum pacificus]
MKFIKLFSILTIFSLIFTSCSDNDDPIPVQWRRDNNNNESCFNRFK